MADPDYPVNPIFQQGQPKQPDIVPNVPFDLTVGTNHLMNSLEQTHPNLSPLELQTLGNVLLTKIGNSISSGEQLASVKPRPDGSADLRIWEIGLYSDNKGGD